MSIIALIVLIVCATIVAIVLLVVVGDAIQNHSKAKYGYQMYSKLRNKEEEQPTWKSEVREVPLKYGSTDDPKDVEPGCR